MDGMDGYRRKKVGRGDSSPRLFVYYGGSFRVAYTFLTHATSNLRIPDETERPLVTLKQRKWETY